MIQMYECKISRRGKAAKGTVIVKTFGKPIVNDDGIAKDWDYSEYEKVSTSDAIDAVRNIKQNPVIAMFQGADILNKSEAMRMQNLSVILTARILAEGLATDKDEARAVAVSIIDVRAKMVKLGIDEDSIPTIDDLLEKRKAFLVKSGKTITPRLVDNREDSSEEDSEDEDSEEDSSEEDSE